MHDHMPTHGPGHPHDRVQTYDWTPLLSALGVFLHTYLRDVAAHQRTLRPFVLTPALPTRAAWPTLLGLGETGQIVGLEYLLVSAGLLQVAETGTVALLPQPALAWPVLDQVLTALLPALDPDHVDYPSADAAVRILRYGGLLQDTEPQSLFDVDGAWPDLLPLLLDDERWQRLFTHLHGTEALVAYQEHAHIWVVDAWRERARRDQAQAELAAYLLAAQRPEEPGAGGPESSDPQAGGGAGGSTPDAPDAVAGGSPSWGVAGGPDPGATHHTSSLADHDPVAGGSPLRTTMRSDRPQEPPISLSLADAGMSLADRSLTGESLMTQDSLNDTITTTTQESRSDTIRETTSDTIRETTSDTCQFIERHLRAEELASTRLDVAFWREVNRILTSSDTRYPHTPGEKKAAERQFKRQQIPTGVVLAALRVVVSLPDRPRTFGDAIGSDTFQIYVAQALSLVPQPSAGRDWWAFLHAYRQIGRAAGLRDVRPADYTALQALFGAQPDRCWQVIARWTEVPPTRVSPALLRRAVTSSARPARPTGIQSSLPWDPPPARSADDPRHALLLATGLSPRLLTPGMTEDYLRAWLAEADARAAELTNRTGWLTWGIRSGHWPEAHPQLRQRQAAHRTPPVPAASPAPAPVRSAEQVAWQEVWSAVQRQLVEHVPVQDYATWLQETALVDLDHGQAIIATPNIFARERVAAQYAPLIAHALQQQTRQPVQVQVVLDQRSFGFGGRV